MNITEHEMRGLLAGKCLPGDMRVNEELPAYLVRKFAELKAERDAMAAENLALRNAHPQPFGREMMKAIDAYQAKEDEVPEQGMMDAFFILRDSIRISQEQTDAYLNSVRAEGVEMAADFLKLKNTVGSTDVMAYLLNTMAFELRAGKDGV